MNIGTIYSPEDQKKIDTAYETLANYEKQFIAQCTKNIRSDDVESMVKVKRALFDDPVRQKHLNSISDLISVMMPKTIIKLNN